MTQDEIQLYKNNRGVGTQRLKNKRKNETKSIQSRNTLVTSKWSSITVSVYSPAQPIINAPFTDYLRPEVGLKQRKESPSPRRCWSSQKTCRNAVENMPEQVSCLNLRFYFVTYIIYRRSTIAADETGCKLCCWRHAKGTRQLYAELHMYTGVVHERGSIGAHVEGTSSLDIRCRQVAALVSAPRHTRSGKIRTEFHFHSLYKPRLVVTATLFPVTIPYL
jgi:hypothetical protein